MARFFCERGGIEAGIRGVIMKFDSETLLAAFDDIGRAALEESAHIELAIYGGSELMIAGNFRYATEDVDMAEIADGQPQWFLKATQAIADKNGWPPDWINDAVQFHLSPLADRVTDHVEFGSFPRGVGPYGLDVIVPTAEYMLAPKLKSIRLLEPVIARREVSDIINLATVVKADSIEKCIVILGKYFPKTAQAAEKQVFLLKRLNLFAEPHDAPIYPRGGGPAHKSGRAADEGTE